MPANAVKPGEEALWERAKKQAAKQGQTGNYAYIMKIFQQMKGGDSVEKATGGGLFTISELEKRARERVAERVGGRYADEMEAVAYDIAMDSGEPWDGPVPRLRKADRIPGGLAAGRTPSDFDPSDLADGVAVEMEHTTDRAIATEIAMDHLTEDRDYYRKLARVEKSATSALDRWLRKAAPPSASSPAGGGAKAPAGFTPIPNSKTGGYHRKMGSGYEYWYPGIGVTKSPKAEDNGKAKGAKQQAKPAGAKGKAQKPTEGRVIVDPSELPDGFNDMPKEQRAALTASWDVVEKQMGERFGKPKTYAGDLGPAIEAHIDELVSQGAIVPKNGTRAKAMLTKMAEHGKAAGVDEAALATLMEENVRKLAHQEIESVSRTLGDHGVRHLSVNAAQSDAIFEELKRGGMHVEPIDHFMAYQVWIDHDMGYTVPAIARGGFAVKDNYHPQASAMLSLHQRDKLSGVFGKQGFNRYARAVANHSGTEVDWKADYFGSAVRLADNTHLFADKMPEVLFDSDTAIEAMVKVQLASEVVKGKGGKRSPEQKQQYKALVGGVKRALVEQIEARDDLPRQTKDALVKATSEIGELTPKFLISRLAGRNPTFRFTGTDMHVEIEQSQVRESIGRVFGDDETDRQFVKLLKDYGTDPTKALAKKPPPPGVYVGEKGRGIEFAWSEPKRTDPAEKRHAEIMTKLTRKFESIQATEDGAQRDAQLARFFGTEVAKAMKLLISLEKAEPARKRRPTAPTEAIPYLTSAQTRAQDKAPSGFEAIPNSRKGGFRKRVGAKYVYWYPSMAGHQRAAKPHPEDRPGYTPPVEPSSDMRELLGAVLSKHGEAKVKRALESAAKGTAGALDNLLRQEAASVAKDADIIPLGRRAAQSLRKRRTEKDLTKAVQKLAKEDKLRQKAEQKLKALEPKVADVLTEQAGKAAGEKEPSKAKAVLKAILKGGIGPFAFGFIDNFLLYCAGASIDKGLATMGFSAAAVAGLGNAVSDSVGQGVADKIEGAFDKVGLGKEQTGGALSEKTEGRIKAAAGIAGVFTGALAGMVPMLFGVTFGKSRREETSPTASLDDWLGKSPFAAVAAASAAASAAKRRGPTVTTYKPPKASLADKVRTKLGKRPPGAGWQPIPGGRKNGYRKRTGDGWAYWYPGMGASGGSHQEARAHVESQDREKKTKEARAEIKRLEKESSRWQERAARAHDQGDRKRVKDARDKMQHYHQMAQKIRKEHGMQKLFRSDSATRDLDDWMAKADQLKLFNRPAAKAPAKPPGASWQAIPSGKHGGFRRRQGKGWQYWYPGEKKVSSAPHQDDIDPKEKHEMEKYAHTAQAQQMRDAESAKKMPQPLAQKYERSSAMWGRAVAAYDRAAYDPNHAETAHAMRRKAMELSEQARRSDKDFNDRKLENRSPPTVASSVNLWDEWLAGLEAADGRAPSTVKSAMNQIYEWAEDLENHLEQGHGEPANLFERSIIGRLHRQLGFLRQDMAEGIHMIGTGKVLDYRRYYLPKHIEKLKLTMELFENAKRAATKQRNELFQSWNSSANDLLSMLVEHKKGSKAYRAIEAAAEAHQDAAEDYGSGKMTPNEGRRNSDLYDQGEAAKKLHRQALKRRKGKSEMSKAYFIKSCLIEDSGSDAAASECLEKGGVGVQAHTQKTSLAPEINEAMAKGSAMATYPAVAHPGDYADAKQRREVQDEMVHFDPAGNQGNGGLPEWFQDTWADQEHVRTPEICLNMADMGPTRVIDDDDAYARKLLSQDPRGDAMALELAYKNR